MNYKYDFFFKKEFCLKARKEKTFQKNNSRKDFFLKKKIASFSIIYSMLNLIWKSLEMVQNTSRKK